MLSIVFICKRATRQAFQFSSKKDILKNPPAKQQLTAKLATTRTMPKEIRVSSHKCRSRCGRLKNQFAQKPRIVV